MVQRYCGTTDFINESLATRLDFIQIWWTERRIGRAGENKICHFQVTHRPIIRCRLIIHLFRYPQRSFPRLIVRPNITHQHRINFISENDHCVIAYPCFTRPGERAGDYDVRVS